MEKLNSKQYEILLDLIEKEKEIIRKDSYVNPDLADMYHELGIISVKLYSQLKLDT